MASEARSRGGFCFGKRLVTRARFGFRLWLLTNGLYCSGTVYKGGKKRHLAKAS